jgi:glycosyltransferase involved in cell wall biosynthesis
MLPSLNGGGAERVAVTLMRHCDPDRFDMRLALLRRTGPYLADVDPSLILSPAIGETWLRVDGPNSASYGARRLVLNAALVPWGTRAMIRAFSPQVVVSFLKGMSIATYFALAGYGSGRPRWIAREGNNALAVIDDEIGNRAGRAMMKSLLARIYRAADVFLAISHAMAAALARDFGLDSSRIRMIHNAIDVERITALAQAPLERPGDRPFLLSIGRLETQKGHDLLLDAFAASPACRGFELVILGVGSQEQALRRRAGDLGIGDRAAFVGFEPNPWKWLSRATLFVLPSRWEGFALVAAEALACGAPALVTDCAFGPSEIVEHGKSGWVVPAGSASALRSGLELLLEHPERRQAFTAAGRHRARAFDIDTTVAAYSRLFADEAAKLPRS